ncbi:AbgT family transporter, partial [Proteus mirabilis]
MQTKKQGGSRFLRTVEWLGNALPHPVILFIILIAILLVSSAVGEY